MNGGYKNMARIFDTPLSSNTSDAKERLGVKRVEWSATDACYKAYRYVQAASDTTVANGTCLGFSDTLGQVVSSDRSDFDANQPAGVGIGTGTASYYFWIQTGGYHSALLTDGGNDFVDGDSVILHATSDGVCDRTATTAAPVSVALGVAVADDVDADDTVATFLTLDEV